MEPYPLPAAMKLIPQENSLMERKSVICKGSTMVKKGFVQILFDIVNDEHNKTYVAWHDNGLSVAIWKPKAFAENVLPAYYNHNNFNSFERQLNFYGFNKMGINESKPSKKRTRRGDSVKFKHPQFRASDPNCPKKIVRRSRPKQNRKLGIRIKEVKAVKDTLEKENQTIRNEVANLLNSILESPNYDYTEIFELLD